MRACHAPRRPARCRRDSVSGGEELAELQSAFATVNLFELTDCRSDANHQRLSKGRLRSLCSTPPGCAWRELLHIDTPEERKRRRDRSLGSRLHRALDLAHGGHQSWIADISEKGLHRLRSASGWDRPCSRCSPSARTFSQRRQRPDENEKLFSNDGCRCAIFSLSSVAPDYREASERSSGRLVSNRSRKLFRSAHRRSTSPSSLTR